MPKIAIFDTKNINWTHKIFVSLWPEIFLQHRMCFFQDSGQLGSNYVGLGHIRAKKTKIAILDDSSRI